MTQRPQQQPPHPQYDPNFRPKPKGTPAWQMGLLLLLVGAPIGYGVFYYLRGEPKIEQSCRMNGFGKGECSFTNTGTGTGDVCGKIRVSRNGGGSEESDLFCSGQVEKRSTKSVDFMVTGVSRLCDAPAGKDWRDVCSFTFDRASDKP